MQLQLTFDTAENRNAFAAKTGYAAEDSTTLAAHPSLYALAKAAPGFSAAQCADTLAVIVKSDAAPADSESLGDGFYVVSTSDFVATFEQYNGAEPVDAPVKLLSELTGDPVLDPMSPEAQWARIRLSSRTRPFSTEFTVTTTMRQRKPEIIVVDSGINFAHPEFAGLETLNLYKVPKFASFDDDAGHGTGVASAAVGANVGMFTHAKLVSVKVFEAATKPSLLELGAAMDAILAHHTATPTEARVVNMSWNTPKSAYLEGKINALVEAGMIVVAAAGNEGIDVEGLTPAGMQNVITIAASDKDDVSAGFNDFAGADATITTNTGRYLDYFAPGVDVVLAGKSGGYIKVSGTSASAGYASGCIGSLLSLLANWPQSLEFVLAGLELDSIKGSLLLDPTKFSDNQNRIIHLPEGIKDMGTLDYYLGTPTDTDPTIVAETKKILTIIVDPDQTATYSIVWEDPALEADFGQYVAIDPATGVVTITKPNVAMPSDVKIKLVRFKATVSTQSMSSVSAGLIFFASNPAYDGDLSTEVSSALEDLDSVNFFAAWRSSNLYTTFLK